MKEKNNVKEPTPKGKKKQRAERRRAARRAEQEDPVLERIKQSWEVTQRNRATSASLLFGFDTLCKIRHKSNLNIPPIQYLEVFVQAYLYQLGSHAPVSLMDLIFGNIQNSYDVDTLSIDSVEMIISKFLHAYGGSDREWICNATYSSLKMEVDILRQRRIHQIPATLAEPGFISELRSGASLWALGRLAFLSRMNLI